MHYPVTADVEVLWAPEPGMGPVTERRPRRWMVVADDALGAVVGMTERIRAELLEPGERVLDVRIHVSEPLTEYVDGQGELAEEARGEDGVDGQDDRVDQRQSQSSDGTHTA